MLCGLEKVALRKREAERRHSCVHLNISADEHLPAGAKPGRHSTGCVHMLASQE